MTDEQPHDPYRAPATEEPSIERERSRHEGSTGKGIALAWLIMILGLAATMGVGTAIPGFFYAWFLPPLAVAVLGIVLINRGVKRTGKGLLLGLASVVAVIVLLIAACFGLVMMQGGIHV
ncbi:hypothetical protein [Dyella sp.]|uniref:hypothetical protein n=1 Tax=Dyella sp. TaxID=1869338 RepID=UPI002ED465BB